MVYLLAGPFVAIVGIAAVFFVLRRKSVDKRSMYSARRSQIEHKVRAARQRTMAPHGHADKPAEPAPTAPPFEQTKVQPTVAYEVTAYQAPPAAPVAAASSTSAGGWSVVSTSKDAQVEAEPGKKKKKDKGAPAAGDWSLASGDAPGLVADEPALKRPSGKVIAIAQYAVLVVGLVMVLIGVLVMVANSHVT